MNLGLSVLGLGLRADWPVIRKEEVSMTMQSRTFREVLSCCGFRVHGL